MKITLEQIKEELEEIKCFYELIDSFEKDQFQPYGRLKTLIDRYSRVIDSAPSKIKGYYLKKYMLGATIEQISDDWKVSIKTVTRMRTKFYAYLLENLNKEEK